MSPLAWAYSTKQWLLRGLGLDPTGTFSSQPLSSHMGGWDYHSWGHRATLRGGHITLTGHSGPKRHSPHYCLIGGWTREAGLRGVVTGTWGPVEKACLRGLVPRPPAAAKFRGRDWGPFIALEPHACHQQLRLLTKQGALAKPRSHLLMGDAGQLDATHL